jgi:lysophospholipase L1-like esterase
MALTGWLPGIDVYPDPLRARSAGQKCALAFPALRLWSKFSLFAFARSVSIRASGENIMPRPNLAQLSWRLAALVAAELGLWIAHGGIPAQAADRWVGTWSTAEVGRPQSPLPPAPLFPPFMVNQCSPSPAVAAAAPPPGQTFAPLPFVHFTNQTLRQIVHTSIGGTKVRVLISNAYGSAPVTIGAGHIALRETEGSIQGESGGTITFSGRATMTIPAGATAYSDPVNLTVPAMADLAIDFYLPGSTSGATMFSMHNGAFQTNYISETGNYVGKTTLPNAVKIQNWFLLSRVEVVASDAAGAIVAFGDSITDGTRSTPDTNNRWPDHLARRLLGQGLKLAVLNAAIAGNRILSEATVPPGIDVRAVAQGVNALARFEHHALSQPGVTHIIVLEGINDIGIARENPTPTAEDLISGHKQLIEQAHTHGLKILGATLTPFYGAAYYTEVGETKRQTLNEWIRTGKAYDAVIDFDKVTRDPDNPKMFRPVYDSCDHLHPSDAGYKAMADAIDLRLFEQ